MIEKNYILYNNKTNLINITMGQGFSETEKSTATSSFSLKKINVG